MTDPRFMPRDFAVAPELFGRARMIEWKPSLSGGRPESVEADQKGAAKLQNRFAYLIRTQARMKFGTLKAYARAADTPYDRLVKVLRGEVLMRFEDLACAERLLGGLLSAGFSEPKDAMPTRPSSD